MQTSLAHPVINSKWRFKILGIIDVKNEARNILPHYRD